MIVILAAGAAGSLILLLASSELMVRELRELGKRMGLAESALGFVVALGADAPEISTAVVALLAGSDRIGLGVVEGSNLYNLAGLLGLGAIFAGPIATSGRRVVADGGVNLGLTLVVVLLVVAAAARLPLAVLAALAFVTYVVHLAGHRAPPETREEILPPLLRAVTATCGVVLCSFLLVQTSIAIIHAGHFPEDVLGVLVLPVATSLPNTWAALSLARQGLGDALVAAAFSSNSINLVCGVAIPSLFIQLSPSALEKFFDGPYLMCMTLVAAVLLLTGSRIRRGEGAFIVAMYVAFLAARFLLLGQ